MHFAKCVALAAVMYDIVTFDRKNDVISSVRKHNCALGLGLELRLVLGLA